MNTQTFSIKGVFRDSWGMMKKEFWKYVLVGLILMAVSFVASIFEESNSVYALVSFLLQIYLGSLLVGFLNILGLAVVGVGLFVTVPLTSLVLGHVYVNVIKKRNITEPVSS
jgi:general stress protein CsbA